MEDEASRLRARSLAELNDKLNKRCKVEAFSEESFKILYERKFRQKWKQLEEQLLEDVEDSRRHFQKRLADEEQMERSAKASIDSKLEEIAQQARDYEKEHDEIAQECRSFIKRKQALLPPSTDQEYHANDLCRSILSLTDLQHESLKESRDRLRGSMECKICCSSLRSVVLIPCRHFVLCQPCAEKVHDCPVCRANVEDKVYVLT